MKRSIFSAQDFFLTENLVSRGQALRRLADAWLRLVAERVRP
nr:hypothetical protein [uncultured Gemmiger sp.]